MSVDRERIDRYAADLNRMYRNRAQAPGQTSVRGVVSAVNGYTYDVRMPDGAVYTDVPCLRSALGCEVGDIVLVETLNHVSYVTGVVADSANKALPISAGGTGAASRGPALANLLTAGYVSGDFNSYTTPGCYTVNFAHNYANYPTSGGRACYDWGVLQVITGGAVGTVVQIYWPDNSPNSPYFRTTGWGAWRSWSRIASALEIYPVGAVYISYVSTSPASLFGGTWTPITGRFPYFNAGTGTGGSNTHTLLTSEIPAHSHTLHGHTWSWGALSGSGTKLGVANTGNVYQGAPFTSNGLSTIQGTYGGTYNSGGGGSHNNMPAYQTLYAWRRTA